MTDGKEPYYYSELNRNFFIDCNKFKIIHDPIKSGQTSSIIINELIEFIRECSHLNKKFSSALQSVVD